MKILCGGLTALYVCFLLAARRLRGRPPDSVRGAERICYPAGSLLYERIPRLPGRAGVRQALSVLYPSRSLIGREEAHQIRKLSLSLLALGAGLFLSAAAAFSGGEGVLPEGRLIREEAGGEDREVLVRARGQDGKVLGTWPLTLSSRQRTREECEALSDALLEILPDLILGENGGRDRVTGDLVLPRRAEGYPFLIRWQSQDTSLVEENGRVHSEQLEEGGERSLVLTARLTCGDYHREAEIPVTLVREKSPAAADPGSLIPGLLDQANAGQARDPVLVLPDRAGGEALTWTLVKETPAFPLLALSVLVFALVYMAGDLDLEKAVRARQREMDLAYPGFVSRFSLCLGAGMSIRSVFYRMGEEYRLEKEAGGARKEVMEEVLLVCHALDSGISEQEACLQLARRCRNPSYTRFCSLLAQNLKKGNRVLLDILRLECGQADRQRKDLAIKLGEEASTRLLFPMAILLMVTMVIIMVPAWYSF